MPRKKRKPESTEPEPSVEELQREIERLKRENGELGLEVYVLRKEIARYCPGHLPRKPKTELRSALTRVLDEWRPACQQERVARRAAELAQGFLLNLGRGTVTGSLTATGHEQEDWSAAYRLFSEERVDLDGLFRPLLRRCLKASETPYFALALDDSQLRKTGKKIPGCCRLRDKLSPAFHTNLSWAQRFIQASALVVDDEVIGPARGVPVAWTMAPPARKPGKGATPEQREAYKLAAKEQSLGRKAAEMVCKQREELDRASEGVPPQLLVIVDGSMANRPFLRGLPENTDFLARIRGDAALFEPYRGPRPRLYGKRLPTPDQLRQDETGWTTVRAYGAGEFRDFPVKEVKSVLWRKPTGVMPLRLILIKPLRYHATGKTKRLYRQPAYLLTSDLETPLDVLVQSYVHRWEIEVNFREEKTELGVGQAQVWNSSSVAGVPAFQVAAYGALLLAAREAFGPKRTADYLPLTAWQHGEPKRPSLHDMRGSLRFETWSVAALALQTPPDLLGAVPEVQSDLLLLERLARNARR